MKRLLTLLLLFILTTSSVYADDLKPIEVIEETETRIDYKTVDIEPVSITEIENWAVRKGNEIIHFLQVIVQPTTIIVFILSAFIMLIGSVGRGDWMGKGFFGMITACMTYALVLYAPALLPLFTRWLAA